MSLAHALRANHLRFLLSSCLLQITYACAMIETGTRHSILICACTNPEKGYPVNFPSLLAHFKCATCAITRCARTYRTSKRVQEKGYHTKRKQDSEDILAPMTACLPLECPDYDPSERGLQDISRQATCLACASQPKKKRRRESPRRPKGCHCRSC
jgi:hypothetical protein